MAHFTKFLWIIALAGVAVVINMVRYPAVSEALFSGMEVSEDPSVDETDDTFVKDNVVDSSEVDHAQARRGSMDPYTENTAEVEAQTPRTFSEDEMRLAEGGLLSLPDSRKWVRPIPAPPALYAEMMAFQEEDDSPDGSSYAANYPSRAPRREDYESPSRSTNDDEEEEEAGGYVSTPRPFMSPRDSSTDDRPWNAPPVAVERPARVEEREEISNPWASSPSEIAFQDDSPYTVHRMTTLPENIDEDPHLDEPNSFPFEDSPSETSDDEIRSALVAERPSSAREERTNPEPNSGWGDAVASAEETRTASTTPPAASGSHWDWSSPSSRSPSVDRTVSERSTTGRRSYPDPAVAALEASRDPEPSGPPLSHYGRPTSTIPASTPSTSMESIRPQIPSDDETRSGSSEREPNSWTSRRPASIEGVSVPLSSSQPTLEIRPLPPVMGG